MINLNDVKPTKITGCRIVITAEQKRIKELEAENDRLRQQRDAANSQLDFVLESLKEEKAP